MRSLRTEILSRTLIVLAWGFSLALYARLPESIPTHWNFHGRPDGFTSKPWGAFVTPLVMIALYFVLLVLPKISPRGYRFDSFLGGKLFVVAGLVVFAVGILGARPFLPMIAIGAAALLSVVYSYLLYRRLEGFKEEIPVNRAAP
jgi:uncharacterized membrane protein